MDKHTLDLLNKYNKVVEHLDNPKFTPYNYTYTDEQGIGHTVKVSPLTDFMYYKKLPEVYRAFDKPLGYPLYRYLQSMLEGGYADVVNNTTAGLGGIENLLDLVNPETCPDKFLPYYCKSFGIEWFPDLVTEERGTYYNRTFLCNVGEIYKRRGTEACVKYIAKVLTEMDVLLNYERVFNDDETTKARILWVELQAKSQEEIENVGLNSKVIKRYIDTQIPYYITSAVLYVLRFYTKAQTYNGNFVISTIRKTIKCEDIGIKTSVDIKAQQTFGSVQTKVIEQRIKPNI